VVGFSLELLPVIDFIAWVVAPDKLAVDQGVIVELAVPLTHVTPVASGVPLKKLNRRLSGLSERLKGTGRGDDSAERECRLGFGDHGSFFLCAIMNGTWIFGVRIPWEDDEEKIN
jgi:hypothetical protein